jgi:hypothetical protein
MSANSVSSWDAEVAQADDLVARLSVVDRALNTAPTEDSVAFVERLLDHPPAMSPEDAKAFRIALLTRLGVVKSSPRAVARLVAGVDASVARAERLAAIDALGRDSVPGAAKAALDRIATDDPDVEVRRHARKALERPIG